MNGVENIENMTNLQIRGVSKLKKEIVEQRNISKNLYMQGLHYNEVTQEIEGLDYHIKDNITAHFKDKIVRKIQEVGEESPNHYGSQNLGGGDLSDIFESVDITEKSSMKN